MSPVQQIPSRRRRLKLNDHKCLVQSKVTRLRVLLAHKRTHLKKFLRNHTRRIHELYFLSHVGQNFLDSIQLVDAKSEDMPKHLLTLLDKYRIPQKVVPVLCSMDVPEVDVPIKMGKRPEEPQLKTIVQLPEKVTLDKTPENSTSSKGRKKFSEKLKAEAAVVQRVAELQKEGMWYDKRLPKSHDQPRRKGHWDYLLEEMQWLAVDFAVERKWKRIAARKCAKMVEKYHADKKLAEEKAKKDEKVKVQKIAAFMAKEIRNFWSNVRKLVEYKEQSKIEELRKKTMDQHLSFIVDQTEKISSMLAETFSTDVKPHRLAIENSTGSESLNTLKVFDDGMINTLSDDEFLPYQESDDEETIALADTEAKDVKHEIDLLKKESEMSIDDVLQEYDLPSEYVQQLLAGRTQIVPKKEEPDHVLEDVKQETDYEPSGSESDFEDTIQEEEKMAETGPLADSAAEIKELEEDNMLSLEQLRAKYSMPVEQDVSDNDSTEAENGETDESDREVNESDEDDEAEGSDVFADDDEMESPEDEEQQSSLATLLQTFAPERAGEDHGDDELNSVAAMAESFQPTGYTLSSTSVATKVPPLLKHTLREYQHIGLDWLVTMYDKKLNGILADEMGLGKTIQTIALLAHLAFEKENWGPHLIIVPTSVMLNWEMEFLKWFPGFKVLTYYGSIKERKAKRTGWTKPNTFHACITSYKILIQDHQAFRRKRWKYLILDEAQNIKNFKSQRWQLLLNFSTQRRLLLTGTPLQNNLMELWSLMHFLMPNVFQSHREFRQWFSNPMTGMIEGNSEYNENIIKRLHKVLRPFILRRLKCEVEKQLPQKYEHVVLCRLSKRQRYLYEDFMSRAKTKETLQTGSLLSVINVLMQLRKVCNHPNLFEARPIISPLQTKGFAYEIPSLVWNMQDDLEEQMVSHNIWNLTGNELSLDKETANKIRYLATKNYRLSVRHSRGGTSFSGAGTLMIDSSTFSSKVPRMDSFRNVIDINHKAEGDIIIPATDGDEGCSIILEHKSDPSNFRKTMYTFQKSIVPNPPRLRTPFALFTVDMKPSDALLDDEEFLEGLRLDMLRQQEYPHNIQPSSAWLRQDQIFESYPPSPTPIARSPVITKRTPRVTKLSTSEYPVKLATTPNGSDVIVTTNGVCVVKPEHQQVVKSTTIQYSSLGTKRKIVTEDEDNNKKNLLDAIVVDFEDAPEQEIKQSQSVPDQKTVSSPKINGVDGDGKHDYDDSDGELEMDKVSSKIQRLESPPKRRKRQHSDSRGVYTEIDEDVEPTPRKRKRTTKARLLKRRRLDLVNIEYEDVVYRKLRDRKAVITNLRSINNRRLLVHTVYGADLLHQVECLGVLPKLRFYQRNPSWKLVSAHPEERDHESNGYFHLGYHEVQLVKRLKTSQNEFEENHPFSVWRHTKGLLDIAWTLSDVMTMIDEILKRFVIHTPAVAAPRIQHRVFHPSVSRYTKIQTMEQDLAIELKEPLEPLRPIVASMSTQFPDPRLIQYDCGKLQVLDGLLRRLKLESHRVLIFTQMAKMLDVLEAFLNHHGYIYLRLDGATKIDQRQLLMERFNTDKRIFCFILSTRSGGIGVNLTGADTVIFYDSDWNPTMDAQAQDRCHRIGQTRDVHIYRLVSEKTVEENILKKSNQKKLLGELAIEGGNFTTAYFKKNTIHDIFDVDEGEVDAKKRMAEILDTPIPSPLPNPVQSNFSTEIKEEEESSKKSAAYILESALAAAEDDFDVQAARTVTAEAAAELAEFDEDIPLLEDGMENEEPNQIAQEMDYIMNELSSVELYALRFMETTIDDWSKDTFANAQRELEIQKTEWELEQQQQQNESERIFGTPAVLSSVEEQLEDMITYPILPQDYWYDEVLGFKMPIYGPPTPPCEDGDVYIDKPTAMLYDISTTIPEHLLPEVWKSPRKFEQGWFRKGSATKGPEGTGPKSSKKLSRTPSKIKRRDQPIFAPKPLFDRPSHAMAKFRRDFQIRKFSMAGSMFPGDSSNLNTAFPKGLLPAAISFPYFGQKQFCPPDTLEWTMNEDNALLQAITKILEFPPNLLIVNVAQTPNWDFATQAVNRVSRTYRSIKQCKMRYEQVILPREDVKYLQQLTPPKKKNNKSGFKLNPPLLPLPIPKGRRLKTAELVANDKNSQYKNMFSKKFSAMKAIPKARKDIHHLIPCPNSQATTSKGSKQHAVFSQYNINFNTPLPVSTIANLRIERLITERMKQLEKQKAHQAALAAAAAQARAKKKPPVIYILDSPRSGQRPPIISLVDSPPQQRPPVICTAESASGQGPHVMFTAESASGHGPHVICTMESAPGHGPHVICTAESAPGQGSHVICTAESAPGHGSHVICTAESASHYGRLAICTTDSDPHYGSPVICKTESAAQYGPPVICKTESAPQYGRPVICKTESVPQYGPPVICKTESVPQYGPPVICKTESAPHYGPPMICKTEPAPHYGPPVISTTGFPRHTPPMICTVGIPQNTPPVICTAGVPRHTRPVICTGGVQRHTSPVICTAGIPRHTLPVICTADFSRHTTLPVISTVGVPRHTLPVISTAGIPRHTPPVICTADFSRHTTLPVISTVGVPRHTPPFISTADFPRHVPSPAICIPDFPRPTTTEICTTVSVPRPRPPRHMLSPRSYSSRNRAPPRPRQRQPSPVISVAGPRHRPPPVICIAGSPPQPPRHTTPPVIYIVDSPPRFTQPLICLANTPPPQRKF